MASHDANHSLTEPQALGNDNLLQQVRDILLQAQDNIIGSAPTPTRLADDGNDIENADTEVLGFVSFNLSLINSLRIRNCRLLISAGLPAYALREFESLSDLTFDDLDLFYRALASSIGARSCHNWYVDRSESISRLLSEYTSETLVKNFRLFAATCMECALASKDLELAEAIADSSDTNPPYEHRFLQYICIVYWLLPHRRSDAEKWAEIAIANGCTSQYPYIIKCRSLLEIGDLGEAVACLDRAERFFYSIRQQEAYAAILQERSSLMDGSAQG